MQAVAGEACTLFGEPGAALRNLVRAHIERFLGVEVAATIDMRGSGCNLVGVKTAIVVQSATQLQGGILPTGEGAIEGGITGAKHEVALAVASASLGQLVGVEGQGIIAMQLPIDIEGDGLERQRAIC